MPAKSICPQCGQGNRSPNHVCIPSAVERMERKKAALKAVQSKR